MRIAVVGAGLAGAVLAWRLGETADVYTGVSRLDASGASGGMVRGYERDPEATRLALASLAELRGDPELRNWAGYQEIGSVYLVAGDPGPVPAAARVLTGRELNRFPFRDLSSNAVAVVEPQTGFYSPARLRSALLARRRTRHIPVTGIEPAGTVHLADGTTQQYDAVVIAAGAWTPGLLAASGLATDGFTTKQIQYTVCAARIPGLGAFVDDTTGLYGRPAGHEFLLGLPTDRWAVDPAAVEPDHDLVRAVVDQARRRFGVPVIAGRTVASSDCYHDPAGLALRPIAPGIFTFTGGCGGAAKTVLAASRTAATSLLACAA